MKKYLLFFVFAAFATKNSHAQTSCNKPLFDKAIELEENQEYEKAITQYTLLLKQCPNDSIATLNRGICYFQLGKKATARQDFNKAIALSVNKSRSLFAVAEVYFQAEQYDTAGVLYDKVTKLDARNAEAWFKIARCKWLGRIPVVVKLYNTDYAKDPVYKAGLKDEIIHLFDKAASLDSTSNYLYFYYRGMFKLNFEDYTGALADLERSIEVHPVIKAYEYAAGLSKKLGLKEKACTYIKQWAMMYNPSEEYNPIQKKEIAEKYCKELGMQ